MKKNYAKIFSQSLGRAEKGAPLSRSHYLASLPVIRYQEGGFICEAVGNFDSQNLWDLCDPALKTIYFIHTEGMAGISHKGFSVILAYKALQLDSPLFHFKNDLRAIDRDARRSHGFWRTKKVGQEVAASLLTLPVSIFFGGKVIKEVIDETRSQHLAIPDAKEVERQISSGELIELSPK